MYDNNELEDSFEYYKYLLRKEKVAGLDKEERFELQDLASRFNDYDEDEEDYEDEDDDYEDDVDESNYDPYLGQDVYDDGDSWFEESRRYHNHLRETEVEDKEESEEKKDRDYYRNLYLSDPIDKSADLGNVRYVGDDLGVPQYESIKRPKHWYEKLEEHLQEAQASDETFKKFWDLAEEEYGIK